MSPPADPNDALALAELFTGGGEAWLPLLRPTLEGLDQAHDFLGKSRPNTLVPVRELTFQALKPNPPGRWKVVLFGQNPYPRPESATGIAMFDNAFGAWGDSQFGKVTSIRCIIKAACMWKHAIPKQTSTAQLRALLAEHRVVPPPEWFGSMLTQGVLMLNAALTASSDDSVSTARHTAFWRPVVERIVEGILQAKRALPEGEPRGVVFAWWGSHAKTLRGVVEKLAQRYPDVPLAHVDHCNPAAMGDAFCDGDPFGALNAALATLSLPPVEWLPSQGWQQALGGAADAGRMGAFIQETMELHKLYLERLQGVADEKLEELAAIEGVFASPAATFGDALAPLLPRLKGLDFPVSRALAYAKEGRAAHAAAGLTEHEAAALHLYTTESVFYRQLNAVLRDPDRSRAAPYFGYLRLFFSAVQKLTPTPQSLWRGVALDLRGQYPVGRTVTWWGVSSCTAKLAVARGFLGSKGRRTLFEVTPRTAVSIQRFSAFTGEDEYVLAPGTRLRVTEVTHEGDGLTVVKLAELDAPRLVS